MTAQQVPGPVNHRAEGERKVYTAPTVTDWGTVTSLTHSGTMGANDLVTGPTDSTVGQLGLGNSRSFF